MPARAATKATACAIGTGSDAAEGGGSVASMKAYRAEVRRQAVALGRDPDRIKLLFLAYPIVDTTMEAAQERRRTQQGGRRERRGPRLPVCR